MSTFQWTPPLRFIVALVLGFLIGLEREKTSIDRNRFVFSGVRTFSVISLLGYGCAWLYQLQVALALPVGLVAITGFAIAEYLEKSKDARAGWTSEAALLLSFVVGALALLTDVWVAMALGIVSTMLLSEKAEIEKQVEALNKTEFLAVLEFLLVTFIILPVLPDEAYTQFGLRPRSIWQIVVIVSSIGFVGYWLSKRFGSQVGLWLSGLLGGIVSSTAVTIAVGRIAQRTPEQSEDALRASLLASSVSYRRVLALIGAINPTFIPGLWWKLLLLAAIGVILAVSVVQHKVPCPPTAVQTLQNPFELRPALVFGSLFVVLTIVTNLVQSAFGDTGLLTLSAVVGLTDPTPFLLSLVHGAAQVQTVLAIAILVALMSNTAIKGVYFGVLAKQVRGASLWRYGIWALVHIPLVLAVALA